jgi:hypothetical protein
LIAAPCSASLTKTGGKRWLQKATELLSGHWEHIESSPNDPAIVPVETPQAALSDGLAQRLRSVSSMHSMEL